MSARSRAYGLSVAVASPDTVIATTNRDVDANDQRHEDDDDLVAAWVAFTDGNTAHCPREPRGHLTLGVAQQPCTYYFRCAVCGWLSGWFSTDDEGRPVRSDDAPTSISSWPPID